MEILIAPDSFKEALPATQVAAALAAGWRRGAPDDVCVCVPMADGGEGTIDAVCAATEAERVVVRVTGPRGTPVEAAYARLHDDTAIIEMAQAAGLMLLPASERDPRHTTTYGVGELIAHALDARAMRVLVGLGGSATNDGGAGMAQALGVRLLDEAGHELERGCLALARLATIDLEGLHPALQHVAVEGVCDVDNPLTGERGATQVYAPQKGARPEHLYELDAALANYARQLAETFGRDIAGEEGAGAAGGLGAGLIAFCDAWLEPGVARLAEVVELEAQLRTADLVLTGEGRIDAQTAHGKVPAGVARLARRHGVPCIAVCGALGEGWQALLEMGATAVYPIAAGPGDSATAYAETAANLQRCAEQIARTLRAF